MNSGVQLAQCVCCCGLEVRSSIFTIQRATNAALLEKDVPTTAGQVYALRDIVEQVTALPYPGSQNKPLLKKKGFSPRRLEQPTNEFFTDLRPFF